MRKSPRGARENRPYRWLARYYDHLFTFHLPWFQAARDHILEGILPHVESACNLACGTGTTAVVLARRGIRMYGVDLSPIMCRLARAKARQRRAAVQVIRGDMRNFRLPERIDLVLCEFDALNHVPRKEDLTRVARSVSRALRPGGHFYFDVNNELAFKKVWPGAWWIEKPGVVLVAWGVDRARQRLRPDRCRVVLQRRKSLTPASRAHRASRLERRRDAPHFARSGLRPCARLRCDSVLCGRSENRAGMPHVLPGAEGSLTDESVCPTFLG